MNAQFIKVKALTKKALESKIGVQEELGYVRSGVVASSTSKVLGFFPWTTYSMRMIHVALKPKLKQACQIPTGPWPDDAA